MFKFSKLFLILFFYRRYGSVIVIVKIEVKFKIEVLYVEVFFFSFYFGYLSRD